MLILCCFDYLQVEYLEQGTLWDRVSDAVNTIIRLEEVNEAGKFLPPCVEGNEFFYVKIVFFADLWL